MNSLLHGKTHTPDYSFRVAKQLHCFNFNVEHEPSTTIPAY